MGRKKLPATLDPDEDGCEVVHFTLHGVDLTRLARGFWADELEIERAMSLLVKGLGGGMTEALAIKILTGQGKLVGINNFDLVSDSTKTTEHGNQLSMAAVMKRILDKKTKTEFELLHYRQMRTHQQRLIASPWGAVLITECAYQKFVVGDEDAGQFSSLRFRRGVNWEKDIQPWIEYMSELYESMKYKKERWGEDLEDEPDDFRRSIKKAAEKLEIEEAQRARKKLKTITDRNEEIGDSTAAVVVSGNLPSAPTNLLDMMLEQNRRQEELLKTKPEREKDFSSPNGWVAPDGSYYACGMIEHDFLAERMGSEVKKLEKTHVRISTNIMSGHRTSIQFVGKKLTKRQQTAIWDWCQHHNEECPDWVFNDKDKFL